MASAELGAGSACGPEGGDKMRGEAHLQASGKQLKTIPHCWPMLTMTDLAIG